MMMRRGMIHVAKLFSGPVVVSSVDPNGCSSYEWVYRIREYSETTLNIVIEVSQHCRTSGKHIRSTVDFNATLELHGYVDQDGVIDPIRCRGEGQSFVTFVVQD